MFRVGLYARVSTHDQQTLSLQMRAMREYAAKRGWTIAVQIKEVGSGASERELRENLLAAARRREIDVVLVWRLDRWGRSLVDLVYIKGTRRTGCQFRVAHRSARSDHADWPRDGWTALVFAEFEHEILRERIRAGIAEARLKGKPFGRPLRGKKAGQIRKLYRPVSAKPRSPAVSRSAALPCAGFCQQSSHEETSQRSSPRGPHS